MRLFFKAALSNISTLVSAIKSNKPKFKASCPASETALNIIDGLPELILFKSSNTSCVKSATSPPCVCFMFSIVCNLIP